MMKLLVVLAGAQFATAQMNMGGHNMYVVPHAIDLRCSLTRHTMHVGRRRTQPRRRAASAAMAGTTMGTAQLTVMIRTALL